VEVTQISRTVARALRLNEDLTEAIGMGHDLGMRPLVTSAKKRWMKRIAASIPRRAFATTSNRCASSMNWRKAVRA
jgi:dGTPase